MISSTITFSIFATISVIAFSLQPTAAISKDNSREEHIEHCKDGRRKCYNNSKCVRNRKIDPHYGDYSYHCDCSSSLTDTSFAGVECEYAATVYCDDAKNDEFCANGGRCGSYILAGHYYTGCHCPVGYSGAHCQYLTEKLAVENNRGGASSEALVLDIDDNFYTKNIPIDCGGDSGVPVPYSSNTNYSITEDRSGSKENSPASTTKEEGDSNTAATTIKEEDRDQHSCDLPNTANKVPDIDTTTQTQPKSKPYVYVNGHVSEDVVHAIIDDSTEEIQSFAFNRKKLLLSIDMGKKNPYSPGITKIGNHAFRYCRSLQTVEIPSTVMEIGVLAFAGCTSLVEFVVPPYTNIGANAFLGCTKLESLPPGYTHENGRVIELADMVGTLKQAHKMNKLIQQLNHSDIL